MNALSLEQLRSIATEQKIKTKLLDIQPNLTHGWMFPILVDIESMVCGRWQYWARCQMFPGKLPADPIPAIDFVSCAHDASAPARKMLEASFDCIPRHGSWHSWSGWEYVRYFLDWLLFAFGHDGQTVLPEEPLGCEGASGRLYQTFMLERLILWPNDYLGDMLSETGYGKHNAFYPTPLHLCQMMTQMLMTEKSERDPRLERVLDPCMGTGRFPLCASNYSLRLTCVDIDLTMCKATLVNGYLYAPWLVRPIYWLDPQMSVHCRNSLLDPLTETGTKIGAAEAQAAEPQPETNFVEELSDACAAQAPPQAQGYLFDTEHDPDLQPSVAPILKRRKKSTPTTEYVEPTTQPALF